MAGEKRPIVMDEFGNIILLQDDDVLKANFIDTNFASLTNGESFTITKGQIVCIDTFGQIVLSDYSNSAKKTTIGMVFDESIDSTFSGLIQTSKVIELIDWTSIIGTANLTPGKIYFLYSNGSMTEDHSLITSGYSVKVGQAIGTSQFYIDIGEPIGL